MVQTPPLFAGKHPLDLERNDQETAANIANFARLQQQHGAGFKAGIPTIFPTGTSTRSPNINMPAAAAQMRTSAPDTIFSSIGFGIDTSTPTSPPSSPLTGLTTTANDATEAAVKAVRDAMERGVWAYSSRGYPNQYLHVKLGVPAVTNKMLGGASASGSTPMNVDMRRLTYLLPTSIPVLPLEVVVGGLSVTNGNGEPSMCAAVACVSLRLHQPQQLNTGVSGATAAATAATLLNQAQRNAADQLASAKRIAATRAAVQQAAVAASGMLAPPASWAEVEAATATTLTAAKSVAAAAAAAQAADAEAKNREDSSRTRTPLTNTNKVASPKNCKNTSAVRKSFHRSNSIELLARISAEIHDQQPQIVQEEANNDMKMNDKDEDEDGFKGSAATSYRKLPPGVTPKNNKRLFVKHSYRDHSNEVPRSDELDLLSRSAPQRTPNAAFPLKLHETLRQIELDGLGHIVGWLPHGRSV